MPAAFDSSEQGAEPVGLPKRSFLNKTLWYTTIYALRAGVSVVTVSITTRYLDVGRYGVYSQAMAAGALLGQLIQFGMPRQLRMWQLEHPAGEARSASFWSALLASWIVGAALIAAVCPLFLFEYKWLDPSVAGILLLFVTAGEVSRSSLMTIQVQIDWDEDVWGRFWQDILTMVLPAVGSCGALVAIHAGVVGFTAGGNLGSVLVGVLLLGYMARRHAPVIHWRLMRSALSSGGIFFLSSACWAVIGAADRLLLGVLGTGAAACGLYQMATGAATILGSLSVMLGQMVLRHVFHDRSMSVSQLARPVALSLLFPPLFALAAASSTPFILRVLTPSSYQAAYAFVPAIVCALGLTICSNLGTGTLLQQKRFWCCLGWEASAVLVNLGLNRLLIPSLDAWGATLALLGTYLWICLAIWIAEGILTLPGAWKVALQVVALWAACGGVTVWLVRQFPPSQWPSALISGGAAFTVLSGLTLYASGTAPVLLETLSSASARWRAARG